MCTCSRYHTHMFDTSLWQEACAFAARAHLHQLRRDGKTPYFSHCVRVALTVALKFNCTEEKILAAALLHDVIEDTTVDYDEVLHHFGKEIADIVAALSKDMRMIESAREPAYDAQLAAGPWEARLIKLADVFDNITDADTEKARQMLVGKAHRALKLAEGDVKLAAACDIVEELIGKVQANGIN